MKAGKEHPFSKTEMKVLLLVGDWRCATIIAQTLGLKRSYIYTLTRNMNAKHGTSKIQDLVFMALEKRWILLDRETDEQ